MDLEGRILDGRYQLGSLLGVGGMGQRVLATDRVLERQAAVKVLRSSDAQDPVFVERFRREARAAARLSHPNIVVVFDSGSDADQPYLVMEYVRARAWPSCFTARTGWCPAGLSSWPSRCSMYRANEALRRPHLGRG